MEKVLAATHQANSDGASVSLYFAERNGRAGLFVEATDGFGRVIEHYLLSKYPKAFIERLNIGEITPGIVRYSQIWYVDAVLTPDLFPILRHGQFEDLLTRQYEDPIDALLQSVQADSHTAAQIEIRFVPASPRWCRNAKRAVRILDRPHFQHKPRVAAFYARHILRPWAWVLAWPIGVIDEFQNVTTPSIATILSEGRKFRLNLTCAHQFLGQLDDGIRQSVFGNVGSMVAFQVGAADAAILAEQLAKHADQLPPRNLTSLPKYSAYMRMLVDGAPSQPFSIRTIPPAQPQVDRSAVTRDASRRHYATSMSKLQQHWNDQFLASRPR